MGPLIFDVRPMTQSPFESILVCIPGPWADSSELIGSLMKVHGPDLLFAGRILMHSPTDTSVVAEIEGHNEGMLNSFQLGGQGKIPENDLSAISEHKSTVYLQIPRPFPDTYGQLKYFSNAILKAGGLGIKIENSGTAHSPNRWMELIESERAFDHYSAMVFLINDTDYFFSCGMQNFGLPDCCISNKEDPQLAAYVMNVFNVYLFTEKPEINDGHTFSPDEDSPKYVLNRREDFIYGDDECFGNPLGRYILERV